MRPGLYAGLRWLFDEGLNLYPLLAPELFQVVLLPYRRQHDVHHDIAQIHQHPFTGFLSLDMADAATGSLDAIAQVAGQRAELTSRFGGGDDDPVKQRRGAGNVIDLDVARLDVLQRFDRGLLQLLEIDQDVYPYV